MLRINCSGWRVRPNVTVTNFALCLFERINQIHVMRAVQWPTIPCTLRLKRTRETVEICVTFLLSTGIYLVQLRYKWTYESFCHFIQWLTSSRSSYVFFLICRGERSSYWLLYQFLLRSLCTFGELGVNGNQLGTQFGAMIANDSDADLQKWFHPRVGGMFCDVRPTPRFVLRSTLNFITHSSLTDGLDQCKCLPSIRCGQLGWWLAVSV